MGALPSHPHSYHAIYLIMLAELLKGLFLAGNVSIGKFIVAYPHVRQLLVPEEGCRLILGTDGLWDFLATSKVFSLAARMAPAAAATALCKQAFLAQVCMLIIVCAMLCRQSMAPVPYPSPAIPERLCKNRILLLAQHIGEIVDALLRCLINCRASLAADRPQIALLAAKLREPRLTMCVPCLLPVGCKAHRRHHSGGDRHPA